LLIQHLLEAHQVVDEDAVGGVQGDAVARFSDCPAMVSRRAEL